MHGEGNFILDIRHAWDPPLRMTAGYKNYNSAVNLLQKGEKTII